MRLAGHLMLPRDQNLSNHFRFFLRASDSHPCPTLSHPITYPPSLQTPQTPPAGAHTLGDFVLVVASALHVFPHFLCFIGLLNGVLNSLYLCCVHTCQVTQLCLTLCDPKNCSLPGSSVHGILQAKRVEWVAISSTGFSRPKD